MRKRKDVHVDAGPLFLSVMSVMLVKGSGSSDHLMMLVKGVDVYIFYFQ